MSECGVSGHCCWLNGVVCSFLRDDGPVARRFVCTLREKFGSWEAVHGSPVYLKNVRPFWESWKPELNCGDWPPRGETCAECGVLG